MIIAVDFDKTLSLGDWPDVGPVNEPVMDMVKSRKESGDKIILWTCRSGDVLSAAVAWCRLHGLEFDAVNENLPEVLEAWGYEDTRKIFANEYWDDSAVRPSAYIAIEDMEDDNGNDRLAVEAKKRKKVHEIWCEWGIIE